MPGVVARIRRKWHWPLAIYVAMAVIVTWQKGVVTGHAANFMLFRSSYHLLVGGADIYHPPPDQSNGFLYLYSPTFALLFAPFAVLPVSLGLLLWNGVNALALYFGMTRLLPPRAARLALALVFLDVLRSLQNSQSNALIAGLILLAFTAFERRQEGKAMTAVLLGACIKVYPLAAAVLGLAGPPPRRARVLAWSAAMGIVLAALPLTVLGPSGYVAAWGGWWTTLHRDAGLQGQSVMRMLSDWFRITIPNWTVQGVGVLALLAPLVARHDRWSNPGFRLRWLCSLLIFLVIFNHQAESASFIVATSGVAIWFVTAERTWWRTTLLTLTLLLVSVPRLFFFPYHVYHDGIRAHALDALPCFLVWLVIQRELWTWRTLQVPEVHQGDVVAREAVTDAS